MPSGAFGLNDTGQNAMGRMGEIPNWLYALMQQSLTDSGVAKNTGGTDLNQYAYYLNQMLQNFGQPGAGFFSPQDIKDYGSQVMPGVDTAISDRNTRLNQLQGGLSQVPTGTQIGDTLYNNLTGEGKYTNDTTGGLQAALASMFNGMQGTADTANSQFNSNLASAFGQMMQGVNTTYPYLRDLNSNAYSDLGSKSDSLYKGLTGDSKSLFDSLVGKSNDVTGGLIGDSSSVYGAQGGKMDSAYDTALANVARLLPSGDMQAATASRSFAPAMAAAQRRLRTAGIDPNSPEASGVLQNIDVARGRAMDDVLGANNNSYISALNSLQLGKASSGRDLALANLMNKQGLTLGNLTNTQGLQQSGLKNTQDLSQTGLMNRQGLDLSGLGAETNLATTQDALIRQLEQGQTSASLQQLLSKMGIDMGLQQQQGAQSQGLTKDNYNANMAIFQNRDKVAQLARSLGLQDWQLQAALADQFNNANLQGIDLNTQLYNQGTAGLARGQANQTAAADKVGNLGIYSTNLGNSEQQAGAGFGSGAYSLYGNDLGVESQNAGWLTKLLTSAAVPALSLIPGVGPILAAGASAAGGAAGGGGSSSANPWGSLISFVNPQKAGSSSTAPFPQNGGSSNIPMPWYVQGAGTDGGGSSTLNFPWFGGN